MRLPRRPAVLAAVATALSLLGDQTLYAVLPTYYDELLLKPWHVGVLLSVNRWIRLFTNHVAERLCRRFSPALLFCLALVLGAALTAIYACGEVAPFTVLVIARVLWGLCWSFIRQVSVMTTVSTAGEGRTGEAMGFYNGISRTGSLAGSLLGGLFHDLLGFMVGLLAMAGISLLAVPFGGLSQKGVHRLADPRDGNGGADGWRANWRLVMCGLAVGWVGGLVMSTLGLVLEVRFGERISVFGWVLGVASLNGIMLSGRWVADAVGAPVLGALTDKFGRGRALPGFFLAGAVALVAVQLSPLIAARPPTQLALLWVGVWLFYVCATTVYVAGAAEAGHRGSKVFASYMTALDCGAALGPVVGWGVEQYFDLTPVVFFIGGGLYLAASVVSWGAVRPSNR